MVREVFRFRHRGRRDGAQGAILTEQQHDLLAEELALLERLARILDDYPATEEDKAAVEDAADHLTSLFMLVIVGEFNSGKSAFINALIGTEVMPEGVTPTTSVINLLRYGETIAERMLPDGIVERTYPADFLEEISIVDTPGTNAIIREHEELTEKFVPRSDLVLFVTSSDRPFTESEREFMSDIREWGKKIVIIINKIDLIREEEDVAKIVSFVQENIARLLDFTESGRTRAALATEPVRGAGDLHLRNARRRRTDTA
jgi:small GTP-binding protein